MSTTIEVVIKVNKKINIVTVAKDLGIDLSKTENVKMLMSSYMLTGDMIIDNLDVAWNIGELCKFPVFSETFIKDHPGLAYNVTNLIANRNISPEFLVKTFPLDVSHWKLMHTSSGLRSDFIRKHIKEQWNWHELSSNTDAVDGQLINDYPDKPWSFDKLSRNPRVVDHPDILVKLKNKEWDWNYIVLKYSTALTMPIIKELIKTGKVDLNSQVFDDHRQNVLLRFTSLAIRDGINLDE